MKLNNELQLRASAPKGVSVNAFGTYFLNYPGFLDSIGGDKDPSVIDEVKKVVPLGDSFVRKGYKHLISQIT